MNLEDRQPRMPWYDRRYGTSDGVKFLKFQNFDFQNFPKLRFSKILGLYMTIARRTENRYGRSLGGSVRDSNYVPRGQARSELADRQYGLAVDSTGTL